MKRLLGLVLGLSIWVSLFLSVIQIQVMDQSFYSNHYRDLKIAQELNISDDELMNATNLLLDYLNDKRDDLNYTIQVNGLEDSYYNTKEKDHMVDVKNLYLTALSVRNFSVFSLGLSLVLLITWIKSRRKAIALQGMVDASLLLGSLLVAAGLYAFVDFNAFWIFFHQMVFSNDLWYLNPATDRLIVMVPEVFFNDMVSSILVKTVLGLSLISGGLVWLNRKELVFPEIKFNARVLKNLALITMVVDHVGHFLFPEMLWLRVIGRLAFPIFTFLFALSYRYTHSKKRLALRIGVTAVLGQVLINLAGASELISIFFLFGLGILAFEALDRKLAWAIIPLAITAEVFGVDYGAYGILVLSSFYAFHGQFSKQALSYSLLTVLFSLSPFLNPDLWPMIPLILQEFFTTYWRYFIQVLSIVALIPLAFYNTDKPKAYPKPWSTVEQMFFYAFYPIHIAVLAWLRSLQ